MHPPGSFNDIKFFPTPPERKLHRPKLNAFAAVGFVLAAAIIALAAFCLAYLICEPLDLALSSESIAGIACDGACVIVLFLARKTIPVFFVRVYQRFASDKVRLRCLYTPSCSEYMIVCILKYGVIRGGVRGIKRLKRCHHPNGGEDLP
ncbi:MAG: membrane protein insertion efficiency factor YidD [Clostridiales bacterium]|nr:membrane protein insertion efficiency factor YidD [Clostridiales bacterium]